MKLNRVLLIDDDMGTNFIHQTIIKRAVSPDIIHVCRDGREALNYLSCQEDYADQKADFLPPDLILLDINMPGMDGFEFLDEYQKFPDSFREKIILIMLTTSAHDKDMVRAYRCSDLKGFANKPFCEDNLMEIVNTYFKEDHSL